MAIAFLKAIPWKHVGLFAAGTLFGGYGVDALGSDKAKKVYTELTAAGLRVKDEVLKVSTNVQENANDILADAKALNEERADKSVKEVCKEVKEEIFEDLSDEEEAPVEAEKPAKKAPAKKPAQKKAPAKK
ncbi:MAG: hypothetical protein IJ230_08005 [Clostridia bacterium]|nr:hypothetical protein [Clostridia bacterium]